MTTGMPPGLYREYKQQGRVEDAIRQALTELDDLTPGENDRAIERLRKLLNACLDIVEDFVL